MESSLKLEVFGSKGLLKILETLIQHGPLNITHLARAGMGAQEFQRTLTLGEALVANWANIATIVVGLIVCFGASYILFLRSEIRPGD